MNIKKKNNNHKWLILVAIIMSIFSLMGCNSDGDETISLEYGNAKKMVVGQWIIGDITRSGNYSSDFVFRDWSPGTWLVFFDDGTYSDSSDGGKTPHQWVLTGDSNDSTPYYGGIELDGKEFGIGNMGPDSWILQYPKGAGDGDIPGWELGLDKESDDPGAKPYESLEPEPVVEKRYLVKEITRSGYYNPIRTYYFRYDDQGRIKSFTGGFPEEVWFDYYENEKKVLVKTSQSAYLSGFLDDDMKLKSLDVDINNEKKTFSFTYNNVGYLTKLKSKNGEYEYDYYNGNLKGIGAFSNELNDANINLNYFISGQNWIENHMMGDWIIFAPFGFYGKRSVNLIKDYYGKKELEVRRDCNGNIVNIKLWGGDKETTTLVISYEERVK